MREPIQVRAHPDVLLYWRLLEVRNRRRDTTAGAIAHAFGSGLVGEARAVELLRGVLLGDVDPLVANVELRLASRIAGRRGPRRSPIARPSLGAIIAVGAER